MYLHVYKSYMYIAYIWANLIPNDTTLEICSFIRLFQFFLKLYSESEPESGNNWFEI